MKSINLTEEEREILEMQKNSERRVVRVRASVLMDLSNEVPVREIAYKNMLSDTAVYNIKKDFIRGGLQSALLMKKKEEKKHQIFFTGGVLLTIFHKYKTNISDIDMFKLLMSLLENSKDSENINKLNVNGYKMCRISGSFSESLVSPKLIYNVNSMSNILSIIFPKENVQCLTKEIIAVIKMSENSDRLLREKILSQLSQKVLHLSEFMFDVIRYAFSEPNRKGKYCVENIITDDIPHESKDVEIVFSASLLESLKYDIAKLNIDHMSMNNLVNLIDKYDEIIKTNKDVEDLFTQLSAYFTVRNTHSKIKDIIKENIRMLINKENEV